MSAPDWAGYLAWRCAFAAAIDARLYPMEWLDQRIITGSAQIWRSVEAAIVTEIKTYPSGARDLHGLVAAGALADIKRALIPRAELWARSIGCAGALIESRPGWAKVLAHDGYAIWQVAIRKELH